MPDANQRIAELARRFADELQVIARDELMQMLGGSGRSSTKARGSNGSAAGGAKRSPDALAALQSSFLAHVAKHPGLRIEQINAALGTKTGELALPIRKLIADGSVRAEGQRRSTKYFPAKGKKARKTKRKR